MRAPDYVLLLGLAVSACAIAQDRPAGYINGLPRPAAAELQFSKPTIIQDLAVAPSLIGKLPCGEDGSIYSLVDGYGLSNERLALLAFHPDGTVTSYPYRSVPDFARFSEPKSIFVGNGRVYVLISAEYVPAGPGALSRYPLVLAFSKDGALLSTTVFEQDLDPVVLGVFPSGNIVLISERSVNQEMDVRLLSANGTPIRELKLKDNDFLMRTTRTPEATPLASSFSPTFMISQSKLYPSGENLLLVPLETSGLPIVELDENGVLHSAIPQVPENMVLEAFLSSNSSSLKLQLSTVLRSNDEVLDPQGKILGIATRPSTRISEFSREDGSMLREIEIGAQEPEPACEADGAFRFLTSGSRGSLEVVTAQIPSESQPRE